MSEGENDAKIPLMAMHTNHSKGTPIQAALAPHQDDQISGNKCVCAHVCVCMLAQISMLNKTDDAVDTLLRGG